MKGKFIVFEGCDGSGKSTQIKLLGEYLRAQGKEIFYTAEPTGSSFGKLLRRLLSHEEEADERAIAALFAADRLSHITGEEGVLAHLNRGEIVLCDRYYFSSYAYNGAFVPFDWVVDLNREARNLCRPDVTLFLDLPPEESMKRILSRGDTERYETIEKQQKIREGFFRAFKKFPEERVEIINSFGTVEEVHEKIKKAVEGL